MSESMVERVAKALAVANLADWNDCRDSERHDFLSDARAAIEAMREPTEGMLNAARDWSVKKYDRGIGNDAATGCWHAMQSAALEPKG